MPGEPTPIRLRGPKIEIAGLDYGNGAAQPMLLLHGMRDLAWSMDPIAQAFRDRYRVIALDLRGHGDSAKPGVYTMQHFVADLHLAVRVLALERPVLVGHSLGGQVVAQYAGVFPEHAAALVLIEGLGAPPREGEESAGGRRQLARTAIESLGESDYEARSLPDLEAAVERVLRNHPRLDRDRARFLARVGTCPHPDGGLRWKFDPAVQMTWGSHSAEQVEARWRWIECPVLVVIGEVSGASWWTRRRIGGRVRSFRGYLAPAELQRRLDCFADCTSIEIPSAGHMIHFDQPAQLNTAVERFLTELPLTGGKGR